MAQQPRSWRCRGCGADLRDTVCTVEVMLSRGLIEVVEEDGDALTARFLGNEPSWDACETARFECGECRQPVPPAVRAWLETALGVAVDPDAARYYRRQYTTEGRR